MSGMTQKNPHTGKLPVATVLGISQLSRFGCLFVDSKLHRRINKHHYAGLILKSSDPRRIPVLLENYADRFVQEFMAVEPPRDKPTG